MSLLRQESAWDSKIQCDGCMPAHHVWAVGWQVAYTQARRVTGYLCTVTHTPIPPGALGIHGSGFPEVAKGLGGTR